MKQYEIRIGDADEKSVTTFNDRSYSRLSDAIAKMRRLLELLQSDESVLDDDLSMWIVRTNTKKGAAPAEESLIQMVCGVDEDTDEFCYEGIYYLSKASDFERMIMVGEKKGSWIGDYSVQIASDGVNEVCFFSDLDMILGSIQDLRQERDKICNRLLTIFRRKNDKEAEPIAVILYTVNPDQTLRMQSRLNISEEDPDGEKLLEFIRSEQITEQSENPSKDSDPEAENAPEDIEAVEAEETEMIETAS